MDGAFPKRGDRFEVIADLAERAAAQRIADDDLDLLVDLSTHTQRREARHSRVQARARADHACRERGHRGLSTVDFKLTDRYADVPENQAFQLETTAADGRLRLSVPARRARGRPSVSPRAHRYLRRRDRHRRVRQRAETVAALPRACGAKCWRACPRAKLAFSPVIPALRASRTCGSRARPASPRDRLVFVPQGRDDAENQARYELVDFVLDPMPFGGVNGTLEALDMGVPVVTLVGKRHGERTGYQHARQPRRHRHHRAERTRSTSRSPCALRPTRTSWRACARPSVRGLARSPLTDMVAHTRALERAYLAALAAKAPDALSAASERQA